MAAAVVINQDHKDAFGIQTQEELNSYLSFGNFRPNESMDDFCRRINGVSLNEHKINSKKNRKQKNQQNNEIKKNYRSQCE